MLIKIQINLIKKIYRIKSKLNKKHKAKLIINKIRKILTYNRITIKIFNLKKMILIIQIKIYNNVMLHKSKSANKNNLASNNHNFLQFYNN